MKISKLWWGGIIGAFCVFVYAPLSLFAAEPTTQSTAELDWPDADALLREAARTSIAIEPKRAEAVVKKQVAIGLARQGKSEEMFAFLDKYPDAYSDFWEAVGEDAHRRNEFQSLAKFLRYVPSGTSSDWYGWNNIIGRMLTLGRDEEAEALIKQFAREDKSVSGFRENERDYWLKQMESQRKVYTLLKRDKDGSLSPDVMRTAFRRTEEGGRHYRDEMPFVVFAIDNRMPNALPEAVRLVHEGKDDDAKELFDKILADIPEKLSPPSGAIGPASMVCGIAALQIELGRPEWARETLKKAQACHKGTDIIKNRAYPVLALADVLIRLGDLKEAREFLEKETAYDGKRRVMGTTDPLELCHLTVVLAKNGDREGAAEILRKLMPVVDTIDHPGILQRHLREVFAAAAAVDENELLPELLQHAHKAVLSRKKFNRESEVLGEIARAQVMAGQFDDARKTLALDEGWTGYSITPATDEMIARKRYDDARAVVVSDHESLFKVPVLRKIARAQFADGDKAGAIATWRQAIDSARNDSNGNLLMPQKFMVDLAMDIRERQALPDAKPAMEIVAEIFSASKKE